MRELMPKATIVAIDIDPGCCEAAIDAGCDEVACGDLFAFRPAITETREERWGPCKTTVPPGPNPKLVEAFIGADAINLDLCGPPTAVAPALKIHMRAYPRAAIMATFSYGRDVVEVYESDAYRGIPGPLAGRVRFLDEESHLKHNLISALAYPGHAMPMCACLWLPYNRVDPETMVRTGRSRAERLAARGDVAFERVANVDLDLAVQFPDAALLYGLPAERIRECRRRLAALKAVATRRGNGMYQLEAEL